MSVTPFCPPQHYFAKFGRARFEAMEPRMREVGRESGISFSYGGYISNTLRSHVLAELSWEIGGATAQDKFIERVFKGYFAGITTNN